MRRARLGTDARVRRLRAQLDARCFELSRCLEADGETREVLTLCDSIAELGRRLKADNRLVDAAARGLDFRVIRGGTDS